VIQAILAKIGFGKKGVHVVAILDCSEEVLVITKEVIKIGIKAYGYRKG